MACPEILQNLCHSPGTFHTVQKKKIKCGGDSEILKEIVRDTTRKLEKHELVRLVSWTIMCSTSEFLLHFISFSTVQQNINFHPSGTADSGNDADTASNPCCKKYVASDALKCLWCWCSIQSLQLILLCLLVYDLLMLYISVKITVSGEFFLSFHLQSIPAGPCSLPQYKTNFKYDCIFQDKFLVYILYITGNVYYAWFAGILVY